MKVIKLDQIKKEEQLKPLFTGRVTSQTVIDAPLSSRVTIRQVNFDKGARNKFHAHSIEQILIITGGKGIVATVEEEIIVTTGDIIFIPANEKHWHGAAKDSVFSHLYVMSPEQKTTQLED